MVSFAEETCNGMAVFLRHNSDGICNGTLPSTGFAVQPEQVGLIPYGGVEPVCNALAEICPCSSETGFCVTGPKLGILSFGKSRENKVKLCIPLCREVRDSTG